MGFTCAGGLEGVLQRGSFNRWRKGVYVVDVKGESAGA